MDMLIGETTKSLVGKWHAAPGVKCKGRSHGKEETEASYKAWRPEVLKRHWLVLVPPLTETFFRAVFQKMEVCMRITLSD